MGFTVPWRCLVPVDAVEVIFGTDGGAACSKESGAQIHVSTAEEAPATLSDKIVTISGSTVQKEEACKFILRELWVSQGIPAEEEGIFVVVIPAAVVGAIIGPKGVKIKEIMQSSGADINVGREAIIGMLDNPMVVTGTPGQVVAATSMAGTVLQELADRDRLREEDFRYIPGRQLSQRPPPRGAQPLAVRFIVSRGVAGYIIGKGGQKIRELKEQTGANIQFRSPEEEPALQLAADERLLEIRGDAGQRDQGVRALLTEMDQMPDPAKDTRLLLPGGLEPAAVEDAVDSATADVNVSIQAQQGRDAVAVLVGPVFARIKAVFAVMALGDERNPRSSSTLDLPAARAAASSIPAPAPGAAATAPGSFGGAAAAPCELAGREGGGAPSAERHSPPASAPQGAASAAAASGRPAHAPLVSGDGEASEEEERRVEPESGKAYTFAEFEVAFAATYTPQEIADYWRDACTPVPRPAGGGDDRRHPREPLPGGDRDLADEEPADVDGAPTGEQLPADPSAGEAHAGPSAAPGSAREAAADAEGPGLRPAHDGPEDAHARPPQPAAAPEPQPPAPPEPPPERPAAQERHGLLRQQAAPPPSQAQPAGPSAPVACCNGARDFFAPHAVDCAGGSAASLPSLVQPAFGCNIAGVFGAFRQLPHAHLGAWAQLHLALPLRLVDARLAPGGHLAEIAVGCGVRIDLLEELQPDQRHVVLSGPCVSNALAVMVLQWRIWYLGAL